MVIQLKDIAFHQKITKTVSISPLCLQDAVALYQHLSRESLSLLPWCPWIEGLESLKDIQSFLANYFQQFEQNQYFRLGIYDRQELIGWVSAFNFNWKEGHYNLGYWIALSYRRKGYILYTIKFIISLFSELFHLKEIYILCRRDNRPSRLLAHRLQAKRICSLNNSTLRLYKIILSKE